MINCKIKIIHLKKDMKKTKVNRSYVLRLYGSQSKFEDLRWSAYQYTKLSNAFINHLYFNNNIKYFSTTGLGKIGNQAQQKALGIVKSKKTNEEENNHKKSVPRLSVQTCFANIIKQSASNHFNYQINFGLSFADERSKARHIFAKGTKPLKEALKKGWELSNQCEIYFEPKNSSWYVRVFVSKEVEVANPKDKSIGIDVGIRQISSTSEGYLGNSLSKRLKKLNVSKNEKARQLSLAKNRKNSKQIEVLSKNLTKNKQIKKTVIKQLLDKEAKRLIARGLNSSSNLIIEDPKVLANLFGSKGLRRWAKTYFAYRLQMLGKESGVFVMTVHPAYTSITCPLCGEKDKRSRDKLEFCCVKCGHKDHADINGAVNLALKGQEQVVKFIIPSLLKKLKSKPVSALSDSNLALKKQH